jgi:hypothetical protein
MTGWKGRRQLASRWIKLYLHVVILPEGRILLELKARGGGGAAAAAELIVDPVQMHRGCAGARGGLPALGRGGGGGGGSEVREKGKGSARWVFGLKWGAEAARRWPISNLGPALLELRESKTIAAACGVGPVQVSKL